MDYWNKNSPSLQLFLYQESCLGASIHRPNRAEDGSEDLAVTGESSRTSPEKLRADSDVRSARFLLSPTERQPMNESLTTNRLRDPTCGHRVEIGARHVTPCSFVPRSCPQWKCASPRPQYQTKTVSGQPRKMCNKKSQACTAVATASI